MKKTMIIICITAVLCAAMITGSALAAINRNALHYSHYGEYYKMSSNVAKEVPRTMGMLRTFYDSYAFSSYCHCGAGSYNNTALTNSLESLGLCDACEAIFAGELLPVPAEAPEE